MNRISSLVLFLDMTGSLVQSHTYGEKTIHREEWQVGVELRKYELVICI